LPVNWNNLLVGVGQSLIPLVQQGINAYVDERTHTKKLDAFNARIAKLQVSSGQKPSKSLKLTTGILGNESVEDLGRRKWTEYEKFLNTLPDNATPSEAQSALQQIESNIVNDYPCESCRENSAKSLKKFPLSTVSVISKKDAQKRLCGFHNVVREFLGKDITHDCKVLFN